MAKRRLIKITPRKMMFGAEMHDMPKKHRGRVAEHIIAIKLHEFGIWCLLRQRCPHCERYSLPDHTDIAAFKPFIKNPLAVPVQCKSCSLEKHGWEIRVDDSPLEAFDGFYIILFEYKPNDILLYIKSDKMKELMHKNGKMESGKARHHKDYWSLPVPRSLKGFKQYLKKDQFVKAVLENPYRKRESVAEHE